MPAAVLPTPSQTIAFSPALARPAPTRPPTRAWDEDDGMPASQVTMFQTIAPISAPKISRSVTTCDRDDAGADGVGDVQAEEQEGDEVEERRPGDGVARRQHPGGDDGGDGVGGVVQAVQEVERQRDGDQQPEGERRRSASPRSELLDQDAADAVGDILEAVDHLLQVVEDVGADDEVHRPVLAGLRTAPSCRRRRPRRSGSRSG